MDQFAVQSSLLLGQCSQLTSLRCFRPPQTPEAKQFQRRLLCRVTPAEKEALRRRFAEKAPISVAEPSRRRADSARTEEGSRQLRDFEGSENEAAAEGSGEFWSPEDDVQDLFAEQLDGDGAESAVVDFGWGVDDLDTEEDSATNAGWEVASDTSEPEDWRASSGGPGVADDAQKTEQDAKRAERLERWAGSPAMNTLPRHVIRALDKYQDEADTANEAIKKANLAKPAADEKVHRRLRVIRGTKAGRRLLSGKGDQTRPMMEVVRAAAFDMLQARCGSTLGLPQGASWLDLFAGTGSVGLEAISRGVQRCCFIELDRWVVDRVLLPNLASCEAVDRALVHTMRAEDYLARAKSAPEYHAAFDFISVCPPYLKVSYEELFELLEGGPLLHDDTHVLVEYPRKSRAAIPQRLGPLPLVKDRRFGRTNLAIFGPA